MGKMEKNYPKEVRIEPNLEGRGGSLDEGEQGHTR
jgi:hypothetical protein